MISNQPIKELVSEELQSVLENSFTDKVHDNIVKLEVIFEHGTFIIDKVLLSYVECKKNETLRVDVSNVKLKNALLVMNELVSGHNCKCAVITTTNSKFEITKLLAVDNVSFSISMISNDKCTFSIFKNDVR